MTADETMPPKRERLADTLYGRFMQQLASGLYSEGDKLPTEKELCTLFDVSRPVVREALMRLQADGLVVARQGAGTFVKKRPPRRLIDLAPTAELAGFLRSFEIRIALEGQAAKLAATRRTDAQLDEIATNLALMSGAIERGEPARDHDFAFHRAVASASGNELFVIVLDTIAPFVGGSMTLALGLTREGSPERSVRVLDEHARIHEAIAQGDGDGAELAMRYHIDQARRRVTDRRRDP
jgi:DNA-binding FadR family transcriptional regulator